MNPSPPASSFPTGSSPWRPCRSPVEVERGPGPSSEPLIADVKRGALDDGPGIRSVVFFKGCALRCVFCQNPETQSTRAEVQRRPDRCTGCGACVEACPAEVARPGSEPEDQSRCFASGSCVEACPVNARRVVGERIPLDALGDRLLRDLPFYRRSGGGVTLSGGEPALHPRYAGALAARLRAAGVHVLLETAGAFGWRAFAEHLLPHLDAVYFDVKILDPARHRAAVGVDNHRILANLARLVAAARGGRPSLLVRVPLVPGLTDDPDNLTAIAAHVASLGLSRLALLPYNPLWLPKRRGLAAGDAGVVFHEDRFLSEQEIEACRETVRRAGLAVI